jgi:catechol 2,3-dioxygenase-like lactoylglutathione lyase family enzyme
MHEAPAVDCEQLHPILYVADVAASVDFYEKRLGFWTAFNEGDGFAGVNLGDVQIFLERHAPGTGAVYFVVSDTDTLYDYHRANGVEIVQEIGDRPYGLRDYTVRDLNGYSLTFGRRLK